MQRVTAISFVVVLSVLLGSSSDVLAANNFVLEVNVASGYVVFRSDFAATVWIDQYSISSAFGSLVPAQWYSLDDQNAAGFNWHETSETTMLLSESKLSGQASFQSGTGVYLLTCFNPASLRDLVFRYRLAGSSTLSLGEVSYVTTTTIPPAPVQVPLPCIGDVNGNSAVNIDDLVQVITTWGPCTPPPGACPADIAPSNGGNGTVNIDDLVAVITHWGACP